MLDLFLVRHAHVDPHIINSDPGLTEIGSQQAGFLADWLSQNMNFDAVYSSDMRRTMETIAPFVQRCSKRVLPEARLREYRSHMPETLIGEESWEAFYDRVNTFLLEMMIRHDGEQVLWMTHGGVFDILIATVLRVGNGEALVIKTNHTGISHFQCEVGVDMTMVYHNQVQHLSDELQTA